MESSALPLLSKKERAGADCSPHASGSHTEKMNALVEGHPHKQESAKRVSSLVVDLMTARRCVSRDIP